MLQAFDEKRTRHSRETIFDYLFYYAKRGPQDVWIEPDTHGLSLVHGFEETVQRTQSAFDYSGYTDAHAWVFVPSSFCLIVDFLRRYGLTDFYVGDVQQSDGPSEKHEFYVVLRKHGNPETNYLARLQTIERELAEISH